MNRFQFISVSPNEEFKHFKFCINISFCEILCKLNCKLNDAVFAISFQTVLDVVKLTFPVKRS